MTKTIVGLLTAAAVAAAILALPSPSPSFAAPLRQDLPVAFARFIQAAPDLGGVDVYLNGARLPPQSLWAASWVSDLSAQRSESANRAARQQSAARADHRRGHAAGQG